jgi:glycine cleavage system T protein (aminomethyltransferase)
LASAVTYRLPRELSQPKDSYDPRRVKKTPLYDTHVKLGARLVDFAGWKMPLAYGSQVEEHHAVRRHAGLFDVSHMTIVDFAGRDAQALLGELLANDVGVLDVPGAALYSCMLREDAGILDDVIAYRKDAREYRIVSNAATRERNLQWMSQHARGRDVALRERVDLALIAVQGPGARELAAGVLEQGARCLKLAPFTALEVDGCFVARTGYTGEDGFEIAVPADKAATLWEALMAGGARACGLGARDTLRLEAGLNLYGADMDEQVSPYECGLGWTVSLTAAHAFIGRAALERRRAEGLVQQRVGLLLEEPGVMRAGYALTTERGPGVITSGGYAPTLERSVALARVPTGAEGECKVTIRDRVRRARIVKPPFVRRGKVMVKL